VWRLGALLLLVVVLLLQAERCVLRHLLRRLCRIERSFARQIVKTAEALEAVDDLTVSVSP
jgi:hypothetical protein